MRIFLTGGTGFIGGRVAAALRERGDEVVALVRSPRRATELERLGCEPVAGDLADAPAIASGVEGADAVIHGAAVFEVGIPASERPAMYEANVRGTERVLGAALAAATPRVVYVSTVAAFGNTHGEVVDESYSHPADSFTSYYEQTKYEAHRVATRLISEGLPCVVVQPGAVYGPDDHSAIGKQVEQFVSGRLPFVPFGEFGMNMVHVDDAAAGIVLALDRGEFGESYILGGELTTMRGLLETAATVTGRRPPLGALPTALMRALTPVGPLVGRLMGQPPNLRELIASADGVTFWARDDRARAELGYEPRDLATGLRQTFEAEGRI